MLFFSREQSSKLAEQFDAQGERNIITGHDVINSIINTGDHTRFFIGDYERLRDAYMEPWSVFLRVDLGHFAGREWLIAKIDTFLHENDRGYFVLEAEAGPGKTTFLAWLVRERGYIHHFAELAPGLDGIGGGLKNIAAQLILAYHLNVYEAEDTLSSSVLRPDYLFRLLRQTAQHRVADEKIVLVIDALDELGVPQQQNVLGLPVVLPEGVYIIVSQRPVPVSLSIDTAITPRSYFRLTADDQHNQEDMCLFLEKAATWPGISQALLEGSYASTSFVKHLLEKCHGVWIYLHYIVYEINRGERNPLNLDALPDGMTQYYARYWQHWRMESEERWYQDYLPFLATLASVQEASEIERLVLWSNVKLPIPKLRRLLQEQWRPFIALVEQRRYRFYHATLREFFEGHVEWKKLTESEISLVEELTNATHEAHQRIVEYYQKLWGGLGRVCKPVLNWKDEKRRTNGRAMGEAGPVASAPEAKSGTSSTRSSPDSQWHPVDLANRSSVEGLAGAVWSVAHSCEPILSMGQSGGVATNLGSPPTASRCSRRD